MTDNIFCNNCLGYRIYEVNKYQFQNPFQWCVIKPLDMLYLINEYENIDFTKYELGTGFLKNGTYFKTRVDNKFDAWWVHHYKDPKYKEPTKVENHRMRNADMRYEKIEDYINEMYERRVKRMCNPPTFIVNFDFYWGMSNQNVFDIGIQSNKKESTILVSSDHKNDNAGCGLSIVLEKPTDYDIVAKCVYDKGYFRLNEPSK